MTERLELRPEWVEDLLADPAKTMTSTSALARDHVRLVRQVRDRHGMRLADLEVPRETVDRIVDLTKRYIGLCDAAEHLGGGYDDDIRAVDAELRPLQEEHRLPLARDWMLLHKVLTRTP